MQRAATPGSAPPATPDEIRGHLERVLSSPAFRGSKRSHRFLSYIVDQLLAGNASAIKERTLATEVFDRSASWDSGGEDTIVRVGAREVRKRLAQFYASAEGLDEKLRIELPVGSYVPEIVRVEPSDALVAPAPFVDEPAVATAATVAAPPDSVARQGVSWRLAVGLILLAVLLMCVIFWEVNRPTAFEAFWQPYLHASEPILICMGSPIVYSPTANTWSRNDQKNGHPSLAIVQRLNMDPKELSGADFVAVDDKYLAFGDALAATDIELLMARHSLEAHVRFASKVEFSEFRDGPVVLLGAFTNRWTAELTDRLRFHFGYDARWAPGIVDAANPGHVWSIPQKQDNGTSPEDYFLVYRLLNSPSGSPVLIAAGIEQFGTEAAGRFLTNKEKLQGVLRTLKPGWEKKNLALVMHAKVIENSPTTPELVSSYVW